MSRKLTNYLQVGDSRLNGTKSSTAAVKRHSDMEGGTYKCCIQLNRDFDCDYDDP